MKLEVSIQFEWPKRKEAIITVRTRYSRYFISKAVNNAQLLLDFKLDTLLFSIIL